MDGYLMKQISVILLSVLAIVLSGCSDEVIERAASSSQTENERYDRINVKGAKLIYSKSQLGGDDSSDIDSEEGDSGMKGIEIHHRSIGGVTLFGGVKYREIAARSSDSDSDSDTDTEISNRSYFYKRDADGNESRLRYYDADGNVKDIDIQLVKQVSKQYVLCVLDELHSGWDDDIDSYYACLVSLNDERMHRLPDDIDWMSMVNAEFFTDGNNKFYVCGPKCYEIDLTTFAVEQLLTDERLVMLTGNNWSVTRNGYLMFGQKVRCPNGNVVTVGDAFAYNNKIYSLECNDSTITVNRWDEIGSYGLEEHAVTTFTCGGVWTTYNNGLRNRHLLVDRNSNIYEFDGTTVSAPVYNGAFMFASNDAIYLPFESGFLCTSLADYGTTTIDLSDYELFGYDINNRFSNILFTGMEKSSGMYVTGMVNCSGAVEILHRSANELLANLIQVD